VVILGIFSQSPEKTFRFKVFLVGWSGPLFCLYVQALAAGSDRMFDKSLEKTDFISEFENLLSYSGRFGHDLLDSFPL
jgi:hypothetical protein